MQSEILDQMPPSDLDAERAVLGCVLLKAAILDDIGSKLRTEDFYDPRHRTLYRHVTAMYDANRAVDVKLLLARLRQAGELVDEEAPGGRDGITVAYLGEVAGSVAVYQHAIHYADLVVKAARYRAMIATSTAMLQAAYAATDEPTEILNRAEAALCAIDTGANGEEPVSAWEATREAVDAIDLIQQRGRSAGIMTGLHDFDQCIGGLFAGELVGPGNADCLSQRGEG